MAVAEGTETPKTCEPNVVYIGEGVTFKGELSAPELVVIDGAVEGEVRARCARVGATGSLKGSVIVTDADIEGSVSDRLEVKRCWSCARPGMSRPRSPTASCRSRKARSSPAR